VFFVAVTPGSPCARQPSASAAYQHPKTARSHTTSAVYRPNTIRCAKRASPGPQSRSMLAKPARPWWLVHPRERLWDDPHLTEGPSPPRPRRCCTVWRRHTGRPPIIDPTKSIGIECFNARSPSQDRESQRCRMPCRSEMEVRRRPHCLGEQAYGSRTGALADIHLGLSKPGGALPIPAILWTGTGPLAALARTVVEKPHYIGPFSRAEPQ